MKPQKFKMIFARECSKHVSRQSISGRKDQVMTLNRHKRATSTAKQRPIVIRLSSWICLLAMNRRN